MKVLDEELLTAEALLPRRGFAVRKLDIDEAVVVYQCAAVREQGDRIFHVLEDLVERDDVVAAVLGERQRAADRIDTSDLARVTSRTLVGIYKLRSPYSLTRATRRVLSERSAGSAMILSYVRRMPVASPYVASTYSPW
jgi:hypothetical protein